MNSSANLKIRDALASGLGLFCFYILMALRMWKLDTAGFFDYDSAKNWLILQEMTKGHFQDIFHHSSPTFYWVLYPFAWIFNEYWLLEAILILCNICAIARISKDIIYYLSEDKRDFLFYPIWLLVGSSTFLTLSARYLSIDSLSLLFFAYALHYYLGSITQEKWAWLKMSFMIGLCFTVNYKIVLFFPIIFFCDLVLGQVQGWWSLFKKWSVVIAMIVGLILGHSLIGYWLDVEFLRYAKHLFVQIIIKDTHPVKELPSFNFEWSYYLKYIRDFENPWVIIGLVIAIWQLRKQSVKKTTQVLFWVPCCFVLGMSLLAKAPRGLLFAYPLIFGLGYFYLFRWRRHWVWYGIVLLVGIGWNAWQLNRWIYPYASSNYEQVAQTLTEAGAQEVYTTAGLGIASSVSDTIQIHAIFTKEDLPNRKKPYFLLRDAMCEVVELHCAQEVSGKSLGKWKEPTLCSPILFLEHCEYTDRSYEEALSYWQKVAESPYQLELLEVNDSD